MAMETTSAPWTDSGITSDTTSSVAADFDQEQLKNHIYFNLRGHTWQFPPHDIARMLSPKLVKKENRRDVTVRPQLDHYDILITHPVVENVMLEVFATPPSPPDFTAIDDDERANYTRTVDFLNSCIGLCNAAYNMIYERRAEITPFVINSRDKRWLPNLQFVVNDKPAGDSVRGASNPIKPDIIAIDSLTLPNPLSALVGYWNLPDELRRDPSSNARQIQFACDLKENSWKGLVLQLATYGRGQYTASPLRVFTVIFGIDHRARVMRVLIFHHGGLTASHEINLGPQQTLVEQHRDLLKIFLSILLWQGPVDAGLPEYTNGESWIVPSGKNGTVIVKQKAVLYYQPLLRSRKTFVGVLSNEQPPPDVPAPPVTNETLKRERNAGLITLGSLTQKSTTPNQIPAGNSTPIEQPTGTHPTVHQTSRQYECAFYDDVLTRDERAYGIFPPGDAIGKVAWATLPRRGVEESMYRACNGDYGTPDFISAHEPLTSRGDVYSNAIYLPPPGSNLESYFWKFAEKDALCIAATDVDVRNKVLSFIKSIGNSLECCVSAWDLCECLLHSMLGWLSVYQSGYLQRDVSIGNVLKLEAPVRMKKPFSIQKFLDFRDAMFSEESQENNRREIHEKVTMLKALKISQGERFKRYIQEVIEDGKELEGKLVELGVTDICKAVIVDGDLAAYLPTYLAEEHGFGQLSGTLEFMSPGLREAVETRGGYLQKPVDDIFSYFWLTLWTTVLMPAARGSTTKEEVWRDDIRTKRNDVVVSFGLLYGKCEVKPLSPLVQSMYQLLKDWLPILSGLEQEMQMCMRSEDPLVSNEVLCFDKFAYRSVLSFVNLLIKYRGMLSNTLFSEVMPKPQFD